MESDRMTALQDSTTDDRLPLYCGIVRDGPTIMPVIPLTQVDCLPYMRELKGDITNQKTDTESRLSDQHLTRRDFIRSSVVMPLALANAPGTSQIYFPPPDDR